MMQQTVDEIAAGRRQKLRLIVSDERVLTGRKGIKRLMQMPAARIRILHRRPAHKSRVTAVAPADLLYRAAEQSMSSPGRAPFRLKRNFALARAPLALEASDGKSGRLEIFSQRFQDRLELIDLLLRQVLESVRQQTNLRRIGRLAGLLGTADERSFQLHHVKLDLEARQRPKPWRCKSPSARRQYITGRDG